MLSVNFKNEFNMIDRGKILQEVSLRCMSISPSVEFLYRQPTRLFLRTGFIWLAYEIQQGDPLGPIISFTLHPLILKIRNNCNLSIQAWYFDDDTVIGDSVEVYKASSIIQSKGPYWDWS